MRQKVRNRMAEVGKSVNMTSELGVSFHSDKKRECKRMGKRIHVYGIRSFAYSIPHPHASTASRLRLPRIWNPSFTGPTFLISSVRLSSSPAPFPFFRCFNEFCSSMIVKSSSKSWFSWPRRLILLCRCLFGTDSDNSRHICR